MNVNDRPRAARALPVLLLLSTLAGGAGCLSEIGPGESEPGVARGALDNNDVPDGTACYQDVPMRKGTMSYGVCCFDDTEKGTSECIICDAAHHCTPGGATPGCLTGLCNAAAGTLQGSLSTGGQVTSLGTVTLSKSVTLAR